jgi:8-oxo-dGTP pyrophosphatase MutT (NUDIX family)
MQVTQFSVVIFYNDIWEVLLQDRRNLWKDATEWWWFGWRREWDESPVETAIREIKEETNIDITADDLTYIWRVTKETIFLNDIKDWSVFCIAWRKDFDSDFHVLEWAWYDWVTPKEMRSRKVYETQRVHLSIFEEYIKYKNA